MRGASVRPIGLIAGNGRFPFLFAEAARARGIPVAAVAIREETDPALEGHVDRSAWFHVGQLSAMIEFLQSAGCTEAVMAGQIHLSLLYHDFSVLMADPLANDLLARLADHRGDSVLAAVADVLEAHGIRLRPSTLFLEDYLAPAGSLTRRSPTAAEEADIAFGWGIAKAVAGLAFGQTVAVKDRTVVAVEAIEGTDACIRRAGEIGYGGVVVVKVAKPNQDLRFDVPVVGTATMRALMDAKASVMAVEAGMTLVLDREAVVCLADEAGIALVGVLAPGGTP